MLPVHTSVLLKESLHHLAIQPGGSYVDGTFGQGGHSQAILQQVGSEGKLLAFDLDEKSEQLASKLQQQAQERGWGQLFFRCNNFSQLRQEAIALSFIPIQGILLDLGWSASLLESGRGYALEDDLALDMRYSSQDETSAADVINYLGEEDLVAIFSSFGEVPGTKRLVRAILQVREEQPFVSAKQFADFVAEHTWGKKDLRPQVFQALRIVVNREFESLVQAMEDGVDCLSEGGRLVVISFHSLEHRLVKRVMRRLAGQCVCNQPAELCQCPRVKRVKIITKHVVTPSPEEIQHNRRSRSAQLRSIEKVRDEKFLK